VTAIHHCGLTHHGLSTPSCFHSIAGPTGHASHKRVSSTAKSRKGTDISIFGLNSICLVGGVGKHENECSTVVHGTKEYTCGDILKRNRRETSTSYRRVNSPKPIVHVDHATSFHLTCHSSTTEHGSPASSYIAPSGVQGGGPPRAPSFLHFNRVLVWRPRSGQEARKRIAFLVQVFFVVVVRTQNCNQRHDTTPTRQTRPVAIFVAAFFVGAAAAAVAAPAAFFGDVHVLGRLRVVRRGVDHQSFEVPAHQVRPTLDGAF